MYGTIDDPPQEAVDTDLHDLRRMDNIRHGGSPRRRPRGARREPPFDPARTRLAIPLYDIDAVRVALGVEGADDGFEGDPEEREAEALPRETERQILLSDLVQKGPTERWRWALGPTEASLGTIEALASRAPHMAEVIGVYARNARAALAMGLPASAPPILVVGEPGIGKSWVLERIARSLKLPFRRYPMASSSLSEGISGSHPTWRMSQCGVIARTLLHERAANPVVFVDEFDNPPTNTHVGDPYRPFYALLDPNDATGFVDEFLGFPIDASRVIWVMAANDVTGIPAPIVDRLAIVEPKPMSAEHRVAVVSSIYAEMNRTTEGFFSAELGPSAAERLGGLHPRAVRIAIQDAMVRAAADGRRELRADDVIPREERRPRYGFL